MLFVYVCVSWPHRGAPLVNLEKNAHVYKKNAMTSLMRPQFDLFVNTTARNHFFFLLAGTKIMSVLVRLLLMGVIRSQFGEFTSGSSSHSLT